MMASARADQWRDCTSSSWKMETLERIYNDYERTMWPEELHAVLAAK